MFIPAVKGTNRLGSYQRVDTVHLMTIRITGNYNINPISVALIQYETRSAAPIRLGILSKAAR
jgi:hypothetical protein